MNDENTPVLYETDFVGWAHDQAARLRAMPKLVTTGLDVEKLAAEIENLERQKMLMLIGCLRETVANLIKIVAAPEDSQRPHWQERVGNCAAKFRLSWSPTYLSRINMNEIWLDAQEEAGNSLGADNVSLPPLPKVCPFTVKIFTTRPFDTLAAIEVLRFYGQSSRRSASKLGSRPDAQ